LGSGTPCQHVITYTIGTFDTRFGISRNTLLNTVDEAGKVWENIDHKTLFEYKPDGELKINLIYDDRQQATDNLKEVGGAIDDTKAEYDQLKTEYDSLEASYNQQKADYERKITQYQSHPGSYDQNDIDQINIEQKSINSLADQINAKAAQLNTLAKTLNLSVSSYNSIGSSVGEQFDEGEYVRTSTSTYIDIYQFDTTTKLRRLLEHEMGHSLGLEHVADPKSIMYYLNSSTNEVPTADDIAEYHTECPTNPSFIQKIENLLP
jgi:uncharacterized protein YoxC